MGAVVELRYLDSIANRSPRGPLHTGFGSCGWHAGWPQGLWSRWAATLQHRLPCRDLWQLEDECTGQWCWSWRLLHLRLRICQRVHDGGRDGNWGQEVIRDLGKETTNSAFMLLCRLQAEHNTQLWLNANTQQLRALPSRALAPGTQK